ncbi:MAG: hypothetical protein MZV70_36095 [Desulfobacterales bacterium]|nr:hypothetical protein [Desulfobacterales bacterium]
MNELMYYQRLNAQAKEKKAEIALDMMAEGFMKMHKMATSQTFIMPGGEHGLDRTADGRGIRTMDECHKSDELAPGPPADINGK